MSQPDGQPTNHLPPAAPRKSSLLRKLKIFMWIAIIVLLLATLGVWYWFDSSSVVDRKLVSEANFTAYAPRQSPAGYQLQDDQTSLEEGILTYKFSGESDKRDIVVTVQDRPNGFNMTEISKGGSISSTSMSSGTLYDLSTGETGQYLLDTGVSLIYITSPGSIDTPTVNSLANSLRKIN